MKLLKTYIFIILSFFFYPKCFGQITLYEDVFYGGVTGDGYNPFVLENQSSLDVFMEPGSIIRRAFMFVTAIKTSTLENPINNTFTLNENIFHLNWNNPASPIYHVDPNSTANYDVVTLVFDVTEFVDPSIFSYSLIPAQNQNPTAVEGIYYNYYLFISYENDAFPIVGTQIILNKQDAQQTLSFDLGLSADINYNVGFTFNSKAFCNTTFDGSYIFINDTNIGLAGGEEPGDLHLCTGVRGSFYYQNNQLYGLENDTPDPFVNGTDALASIETYITDPDAINIRFEYQTPGGSGEKTNPVHQLFLAYTSTCDTFSVSTPNDTTLCQGETFQLNATGGQSYEWLPATGLSCADCPNPVFTADSSMFYTVRIWNNDTCSVVRPVKINVHPQPEFGTLTTTPSECGANTGTVTLNALPNNGIVTNWQEVSGATQTSNVFQNLSTGNHTFFFVDTNGCQSADTTVFVVEVNITSASFSVSPQSGAVPLTVQFTNTSQNATNFEWLLEDVSMGSSFPNHEFSTSGTFEIMLVAWQNNPTCADTAIQTIVVYDSLMISVPNVFTPNGDGVNDFFEITTSLPVHCELVIVNRWGNVMYEFSDKLGVGSSKLWDGYSLLFHGDMIEGTYFYDITFSGADEQTLELEKLGILPIKKSGFVEVRR